MSILGSSVRASVEFRVVGVATDPTTIAFRFRQPNGTETSYLYGVDAEIVRTSAGDYYVDVAYVAAGNWRFRWVGTGAVVAAVEASANVSGSGFATP